MLSKIIRMKTKPMPRREDAKSVKIKVTQKDVDDLNKRIRKDIEEIDSRATVGRVGVENDIVNIVTE